MLRACSSLFVIWISLGSYVQGIKRDDDVTNERYLLAGKVEMCIPRGRNTFRTRNVILPLLPLFQLRGGTRGSCVNVCSSICSHQQCKADYDLSRNGKTCSCTENAGDLCPGADETCVDDVCYDSKFIVDGNVMEAKSYTLLADGSVHVVGEVSLDSDQNRVLLTGVDAILDETSCPTCRWYERQYSMRASYSNTASGMDTDAPGVQDFLLQPFGPPGAISWKISTGQEISYLKDSVTLADKHFFNFRFSSSDIKYIFDGIVYDGKEELDKYNAMVEENPTEGSVASYNEQPTKDGDRALTNVFTEGINASFPTSWVIRSEFVDISFGLKPFVLLLDAKNIVPPVIVPIPTPYPLQLTMLFAGALGLARGDAFYVTTATEAKPHNISSIIPPTISGNTYLSGTVNFGLSSLVPPLSALTLGAIVVGETVADMNMTRAARMAAESRFLGYHVFNTLAASAGITVRLKLGYSFFGRDFMLFDYQCKMSSGTVYLNNKEKGHDFAAVGRITTGPPCDFGWVKRFIKINAEMSLYTHWLSEAPNATYPQMVLRGEGDATMTVLSRTFRLWSFNFDHDFNRSRDLVSAELDLQLSKVPLLRMEGWLTPEEGYLTSAFNFAVDLLWGQSLSWSGSISASAASNSDASFTMEGALKLGSLSTFATASVQMLNNKAVLALCNNDLLRFGKEILAVINDSPGPDNCLDLSLLFNGIPNGGSCATGQMCATGRCDMQSNQVYGTCVERLADGAACNENSDCVSGRCELNRLSLSRPGTCLPMGNTGDACGEDDDCVSQRCENKMLGSLTGSCQERLVDGSDCDEHSDCVSNHCTVGLNRKCAQLLARGQQCTGNQVCQSGSCSFCGLCREIKKCD